MPKLGSRKVLIEVDALRCYGRGLMRGIAKYSRLHGPWIFYKDPEHYGVVNIPRLSRWGADGIIAGSDIAGKCIKLAAKGVPVIVVVTKAQLPGLPRVITDDEAIGKMVAQDLLNRALRNFAFCGYDRISWSCRRNESFKKNIEQVGFKVLSYKQQKSRPKNQLDQEQTAMIAWLKSLPKPIGLMACNDMRARDIVEACRIAGLHVPDEVAIVGVDNDEVFCELSHTPVSSVALNTEKAGYQSAELLDKLMSGEKPKNQTVIVRPTHIVNRQSTEILAIEDREVANAVWYIRMHAKEPIQVANVVDSTTLSRRVLEKRFRRILNRSIHDEIRRIRIERVISMLVETDQAISQIARTFGYSSEANMSRVFRQEKQMTPLAYRKKFGRI